MGIGCTALILFKRTEIRFLTMNGYNTQISLGPFHDDVVPAFGQIYDLPKRRQGSIDLRAANGTCQVKQNNSNEHIE
jgi:hypothetical protein